MPKQPSKIELRENRKAQMLLAWKADSGANASPLHAYWKKEFGRHWEYKVIDHPHHLFSRDNSGKWDGTEYLITLNRMEHQWCEDGCKPLKLTGIEYEYLILLGLKDKPNDRWTEARELKGKRLGAVARRKINKILEEIL